MLEIKNKFEPSGKDVPLENISDDERIVKHIVNSLPRVLGANRLIFEITNAKLSWLLSVKFGIKTHCEIELKSKDGSTRIIIISWKSLATASDRQIQVVSGNNDPITQDEIPGNEHLSSGMLACNLTLRVLSAILKKE